LTATAPSRISTTWDYRLPEIVQGTREITYEVRSILTPAQRRALKALGNRADDRLPLAVGDGGFAVLSAAEAAEVQRASDAWEFDAARILERPSVERRSASELALSIIRDGDPDGYQARRLDAILSHCGA
jgi:hypothetical protein